jgi:hypothetical protein
VGLILTPIENSNVFSKLSKLTSTRHKSLYLRILHGDVYTNDRLFKFGLKDNPTCDHCDGIDTLSHRLLECRRYTELIEEICGLTRTLIDGDIDNLDRLQKILGAHLYTNETVLTIHCELLDAIIYKKMVDAPLLRRKNQILTNLMAKEEKKKIKRLYSVATALVNQLSGSS